MKEPEMFRISPRKIRSPWWILRTCTVHPGEKAHCTEWMGTDLQTFCLDLKLDGSHARSHELSQKKKAKHFNKNSLSCLIIKVFYRVFAVWRFSALFCAKFYFANFCTLFHICAWIGTTFAQYTALFRITRNKFCLLLGKMICAICTKKSCTVICVNSKIAQHFAQKLIIVWKLNLAKNPNYIIMNLHNN